jgi:hypothetical protein
VRCSPHTARHTFATEFMFGGASQRTAMHQLGHEDGSMTLKSQHVVEAQMPLMHRRASSADNMKRTHHARPLPAVEQLVDRLRLGSRPRQPLENYVCTCGHCPNQPVKSCPRGNVIYKRLQREKGRN